MGSSFWLMCGRIANVLGHSLREILQQTISHERCRHAEAAGARRAHGGSDITNLFGPRGQPVRSHVAGQSFGEALRANPARKAFATGFMREKFHRLARCSHHVASIIEHNDSTGAQE